MRVLRYLSLPIACFGLINEKGSLVTNILTKWQKSSAETANKGERLLKELNIQASKDPKLLSASPKQIPNLLSASVPVLLRAGSGAFAQDYRISIGRRDDKRYSYFRFQAKQIDETGIYKPPNEPLILYEFEACPFCRKVREACSMLSITVSFRPAPNNGWRYRPEIKNRFGASATFPYLQDPNTGVEMFESDKIVEYLFKVYGNGQVPWTLVPNNSIVTFTAGLASLARLGAGGQSRPSNSPKEPVMLWAYEGSPFCKVVRETLCELEIPHTVIFAPRGSPNRQRLFELKGRFQVPFLQDPTTNVEMFESEAINEYLEKQYGVAKSPVKYI